MDHKEGVNISGVILAGGRNIRFGGKIKAKQLLDGKSIIDRILSVISSIFDEIILVTNTPDEFKDFPGIVTRDSIIDVGPLGGIHAAMLKSSKDALFVFAGDMPFLNRALILSEIESFNREEKEVLVPLVEKEIEPLHGIYSNKLKPLLEDWLSANNNPEVRKFIRQTSYGLFPVIRSGSSDKAFTNINTPDDIKHVFENNQ